MYACTHLSNTASLLLPVSNLTNLPAFTASGLSFTRIGALMALPWVVAIGVEYLVFRRFFAADLRAPAPGPGTAEPPELPLFALVTVACTLAGFVLTSALGVNPAWAAAAGALVMALRALARRDTTPAAVLWRRIVHHHEHDVALKEFTRLGLLTVPAALGPATVALWGSLQLIGS